MNKLEPCPKCGSTDLAGYHENATQSVMFGCMECDLMVRIPDSVLHECVNAVGARWTVEHRWNDFAKENTI